VRAATASLVLLASAVYGAGPAHFDIQATFVPAANPKAEAAVAVLFTAKDPDVKINEAPAPKLKLDASQSVLLSKAANGGKEPEPNPENPRYLDLASPVRFPVSLGAAATKGTHLVKGSVAYFYCSKREGWCRKGTTDVEIPVLVR
jgi:hypothetical protein